MDNKAQFAQCNGRKTHVGPVSGQCIRYRLGKRCFIFIDSVEFSVTDRVCRTPTQHNSYRNSKGGLDSMYGNQKSIAKVEKAIEEIRNGRLVILVDDEDRENEGDLVMAAELCTPEAINFMAVHGRG